MKPLLFASLLLLASCGRSGTPEIEIADAWVRETVAGQSGSAAYATIVNRGSGVDRLISISATAPVTASLHETITTGGISSMRALEDGLEVPAGGSSILTPGGAHIMISGLSRPLRKGDTLNLTLRFEHSGEKAVDFKVASAINGMSH